MYVNTMTNNVNTDCKKETKNKHLVNEVELELDKFKIEFCKINVNKLPEKQSGLQ